MSDLKREIISRMADDFTCIEGELKKNLNPNEELTEKIAGHILFSGGKRLRPLLMLLAARLCGKSGDDHTKFSVMFEYLHAATLVHDDIIDGAELRRGKKVAHMVWDSPSAVLTGDFLLARAMTLAADTGILQVVRLISTITEEMAQGEIRQMVNRGRLDLTEDEYMRVIEAKTAVLIRGACRTGALVADAGEKETGALTSYGYNLGITFQMADDLLDYVSDTKSLGKAIGADLREGKLTLPIIHALKHADTAGKDFMEHLLATGEFSEEEFNRFVDLLNQYGGIEYTRIAAETHAEKARRALDIFPESETRELLCMLADYALQRKS